MGNKISYVVSHGKRLLNRYNAQFRAHKFIDKEKLPIAPRHALPPHIQEDQRISEHIQKKDPSLDKYLKDVYIKSFGEKSLVTDEKNSKRPLPTYSGPTKTSSFVEPTEKIQGLCTLSEFIEFRNAHENDPVENSAKVIAKDYSLDVNKVENLLKYYSVFKAHQTEGLSFVLPSNALGGFFYSDQLKIPPGERIEDLQNDILKKKEAKTYF